MIVNVCSTKQNAQQSRESLDFASKAMIAFWKYEYAYSVNRRFI